MYNLTKVPNRTFSLLGDVDTLLNGFINAPLGAGDCFAPALDIVETADGYEVNVDLPGVKKDDLSVKIQDNFLTIETQSRAESADKQDGEDETAVTVLKSERRIGRQYRSLRLGESVDQENVRADYQDGVLKLTLPRSAAVAAREVDITVH